MGSLKNALDKLAALAPLSWLKLDRPALTPDVTAQLEQTEKALGYVRTGQLVFSHLPDVFLAQEKLAGALLIDGGPGSLSALDRELIGVVVSVQNSCTACIFGHVAQLRRLSGDAVWAGNVQANFRHAGLDARQQAIADYAYKLTRTPSEMVEADLEPMRSAGLSEKEILEASCVIAYFNMSNRLNSSVGVKGHPQAYLAYR